jgi:hypothetical protein
MTERLSFSNGFQFAWDSTSLTTFNECPRKYYYSIVLGYAPREESVHLTFGIRLHEAYEHYHRLRAQGLDYEVSVRETVRKSMIDTWGWKSDHVKNRFTLIRTIVWYLDQFKDDVAQTVILPNGKPAVELSFRFELPDADDFLYCGHQDRIAEFSGKLFVFDYKSTGRTLYSDFFNQFTPSNQMTGYTLGAKITHYQPVEGVMIDGAQIAVGFSRFARGTAYRTEEMLEEWLTEAAHYVKLATHYAEQDHWPMNPTSCHKYSGCPFRPVCSRSPRQRKTWLEADYVKRLWDPLKIRGDI